MKQSTQNIIDKRLYRKLKCESLNEIREKLRQSKNTTTSLTSSKNVLQSERLSENNYRKKSFNFLEELLERKFGQSNYTFNSLIFKKTSKSSSVARSTSKESFECNQSALQVLLESQRKKFKLIRSENESKDKFVCSPSVDVNDNNKSNIRNKKIKNSEVDLDKIIILDLKNKTNDNYSAAFSYRNLNEEGKASKTILNLDEKFEKINCNNKNINNNNNHYNLNNEEIIISENIKDKENKEILANQRNHENKNKTVIENIILPYERIFEDEEDIDLVDYSENEAQRAKNSSINNTKFPKMKLDLQKIKPSENPIGSKNSESQTLLPNFSSENINTLVNEAPKIKLNLNNNNNIKNSIKESVYHKTIGTENSNLKIIQTSKLSKNLIFNNYNKGNSRFNNKNVMFQSKFLHHSENEINVIKQNQEKFIKRINSKNKTYINNITISRDSIGNKDTSKIENIKVKDENGNTINVNLNLNVKFDLNLNNAGLEKKDDALLQKLKTSRENILRKNIAIHINKKNKENKGLNNISQKSSLKINKSNSYRTNSITINSSSNNFNNNTNILSDINIIELNKEKTINNKINKIINNSSNYLQANNVNKTERIHESRKSNNQTRNSFFPKISSKDDKNSSRSNSRYEAKKTELNQTSKRTFMDIIIKNAKSNLNKDFKAKADVMSKIVNESTTNKYINTKILPELHSKREIKSPVGNYLKMNDNSKKRNDFKKLNNEEDKVSQTERKIKNNILKSINEQKNFHNVEKIIAKCDSIGYAHKYHNKSKNNLNEAKTADILKPKTGNLSDRYLAKNSKAVLNFINNN